MNTKGVVQVSLQKQKIEKRKRKKHQTNPTNQTNRNSCFYKRRRCRCFCKGKNQQSFRRSDPLCWPDSHPRAFSPQWQQKFLVPFAKMLDFFFFNEEVRIQGWVPSVGQHLTASSSIPWAGWGLTLPGSERDFCFLVRTAPA